MISIIKIFGFFLLILVGYHYINEPLGFSIAGSIAIVIFALCLTSLYQAYKPDLRNWVGWGFILSGCVLLTLFTTFNLFLIIPVIIIVLGYRLAELPFNLYHGGNGGGHGGDSFGDFGGCDGGGGD
ncbi:MAG: hypothetical protein OQL19_02050 [Gammaproteobacteria bacterium]|nr:hypothetical protein [Gammaproteobacteria bacterium]